jgi:cytoskeletal protein CcmA (bactofilin family)
MIATGTTVRGQVTGAEDLTVEGRVEGGIRLSANLVLAAGSEVRAEIEVKGVGVAGTVTGNVTASEVVALEGSAVVVGDLVTPRLVIDEGARFKGRVTMPFEIPALSTGPAAAAPRR